MEVPAGNWFATPQFFVFVPQTPGAARPCGLASSHKLGRPVGLASPSARLSRELKRLRSIPHRKNLTSPCSTCSIRTDTPQSAPTNVLRRNIGYAESGGGLTNVIAGHSDSCQYPSRDPRADCPHSFRSSALTDSPAINRRGFFYEAVRKSTSARTFLVRHCGVGATSQ